jgi:hypothetical protein
MYMACSDVTQPLKAIKTLVKVKKKALCVAERLATLLATQVAWV